VGSLLRRANWRRDRHRSWNSNRFTNSEVNGQRDRRNAGDAPFNIDCIVVGGETAEHRSGRRRCQTHVHVCGRRAGGMIEVFRMDVKKWRFEEAQ